MLVMLLVGGGNYAWAQKTLFSQDFSQGSLTYTQNVAYTKTSGLANLVGDGDNLFTSITTSNKNSTGIAINNTTGGNSTDATGIFQADFTGNTGGYWSVIRTRDFAATAPTALKMTIDVWIKVESGETNKIGVAFAIGDGFSDGLNGTISASTMLVHSGFSITEESSPTIAEYAAYGSSGTDIYNTKLDQEKWLSFTWIINNTGNTLTYDNPTGLGTSMVENDKFDLWLKIREDADDSYIRVVSGQAATTATKDLQELYIGSTGGKKMEFRMDNIVVYDLTPAAEAYTVTFDAGSHGTCGTSSLEEASIGAGVTLPSVTANTGYTFDGWYTSADVKAGDAGDTYYPSDNLTLYAHYSAKTYTITLDDNGGTADGSATATYDSNALTSITKPTYAGHAVSGYYKEAELTNLIADAEGNLEENTDYTDASGNWTNDGAVTLYTKWQELAAYTVTFNANTNGTCATSSLTESVGGAGVTLPTVAPNAHYVFNGWYDAASAGTKVGDAGDTYYPTANTTLYAQYTLQYTVTYNGNGNTGGSVPIDSDSPYTSGATVTVLGNSGSLVKSGYTFLGWNTESDRSGTNYSAGSTFDIDDDVTLYAAWGENYCELKPATSGSAPSASDVITMQSGAFGGTMTALSSNLSYTTNGLKFSSSSDTKVSVTLNDYMQPGTTILLTLYSEGSSTRGLHLYTSGGAKITSLNFPSTASSGDVSTFKYTVVSNDGLSGTNVFQLWRNNNVSLQSLTVTDCQPGGVINAAGWNTYSSNKKLDLSTISGGTAYVASSTADGKVKMTKCTGIVEAGTGLMIKGTTGDTFTIDATTEDDDFDGTNLLVGLPNGGTVSANNGNYVFGWADAADPGFYLINSTEPTLGIGKAYLHVSSETARLAISFGDDTPTSINSVDNSQESNANSCYYDLQGRKVKNPVKGLYIVGGKKVFVGDKH